jgi:hypothetical protein
MRCGARNIRELEAEADEDAWTAIKYPRAIWDDQLQCCVSDAEVAEVADTAFTPKKKALQVADRLIVRRPRAKGDGEEAGQGELLPAWGYHAVFTDSPFEPIQAEEQHRDHAIIEQVIADLSDGPLAHLPSGRFNANAAWLSIAAIAQPHPRGRHAAQPEARPRQGRDHPPRARHPPPARGLGTGSRNCSTSTTQPADRPPQQPDEPRQARTATPRGTPPPAPTRKPQTSRTTGERGTPMPASTCPNRLLKREPTQKSAGGFRLMGHTVRTVRAPDHAQPEDPRRLPRPAGRRHQGGRHHPGCSHGAPPFEDQAHPAASAPRPSHLADVRRCRAVRSPGTAKP